MINNLLPDAFEEEDQAWRDAHGGHGPSPIYRLRSFVLRLIHWFRTRVTRRFSPTLATVSSAPVGQLPPDEQPPTGYPEPPSRLLEMRRAAPLAREPQRGQSQPGPVILTVPPPDFHADGDFAPVAPAQGFCEAPCVLDEDAAAMGRLQVWRPRAEIDDAVEDEELEDEPLVLLLPAPSATEPVEPETPSIDELDAESIDELEPELVPAPVEASLAEAVAPSSVKERPAPVAEAPKVVAARTRETGSIEECWIGTDVPTEPAIDASAEIPDEPVASLNLDTSADAVTEAPAAMFEIEPAVEESADMLAGPVAELKFGVQADLLVDAPEARVDEEPLFAKAMELPADASEEPAVEPQAEPLFETIAERPAEAVETTALEFQADPVVEAVAVTCETARAEIALAPPAEQLADVSGALGLEMPLEMSFGMGGDAAEVSPEALASEGAAGPVDVSAYLRLVAAPAPVAETAPQIIEAVLPIAAETPQIDAEAPQASEESPLVVVAGEKEKLDAITAEVESEPSPVVEPAVSYAAAEPVEELQAVATAAPVVVERIPEAEIEVPAPQAKPRRRVVYVQDGGVLPLSARRVNRSITSRVRAPGRKTVREAEPAEMVAATHPTTASPEAFHDDGL
jgi:hypothetical protein